MWAVGCAEQFQHGPMQSATSIVIQQMWYSRWRWGELSGCLYTGFNADMPPATPPTELPSTATLLPRCRGDAS